MINHSRIGTVLALSAALLAAACTAEKKPDSPLATDSALNKDLALANRDTTAQPALKDVAPTPAAATPAPAPVKAPVKTTPVHNTPRPAPVKTTHTPTPAPVTTPSGNTVTRNTGSSAGSSAGGAVGTIASGTDIGLRSDARVCTNTYTVGQTFTATTTNAISGSNGATIPAGATVSLEVTNLKRSENVTDKIVMEFAVKSLSFGGRSYPLNASVTNANIDKIRNEPSGKDAQKVVGGAVLGAIAGRIMGKSTVGGAVAGAAVGAGVAVGTANYEGCLADGGGIVVTLSGPLQVKVAS